MDFVNFLLAPGNLALAAVAVVSGVLLFLPNLRQRGGSGAIDTSAAIIRVNKQHAVWVDVRPAEQFQAGHIAQARSLPADDLEQKTAKLPKNKPLIIVCEQGRASPRLATRLKELGYADVSTLQGGMRAWLAAGLPVTQKG